MLPRSVAPRRRFGQTTRVGILSPSAYNGGNLKCVDRRALQIKFMSIQFFRNDKTKFHYNTIEVRYNKRYETPITEGG
jgi:hypothetical protein